MSFKRQLNYSVQTLKNITFNQNNPQRGQSACGEVQVISNNQRENRREVLTSITYYANMDMWIACGQFVNKLCIINFLIRIIHNVCVDILEDVLEVLSYLSISLIKRYFFLYGIKFSIVEDTNDYKIARISGGDKYGGITIHCRLCQLSKST